MGCSPSTLSGTEIASGKSPVIGKDNTNTIASPVKLGQNQHINYPPSSIDDLHSVALTSSSYGFLKLDQQSEDSMADQKRDASNPDTTSVQEVLSKFEEKEDSGPKSWLEVSNILQNLKPEIDEKNKNKKKRHGIDSIDVNEIMKDLDEDTGLPVRPKFNRLKNNKKYSKGLSYHTIDELDKVKGPGKGVKSVKENVAKDYKDFLRDNKINFGAKSFGNARQYGTDKDGGLMLNSNVNDGKNGLNKRFGAKSGSQDAHFDVEFIGNEYGGVKDGGSKLNSDANGAKTKVKQVFDVEPGSKGAPFGAESLGDAYRSDTNGAAMSNSDVDGAKIDHDVTKKVVDAKNGSKSVLFDADFLGSYERSLMKLSEDDWKVVDANEQLHPQEENSGLVVEKIEQIRGSEINSSQLKISEQDQDQPQSEPKTVNKKLQYERTKPSQMLSNNTVQAPLVNVASVQLERLEEFDKLCPPRGEGLVVLYTTSLRKIKKTYEDCIKVKDILQSLSIEYIDERDVSVHLEYRNELRDLFQRVVTVPRLFIHGRYIGGAEDVSKLHEEGKLVALSR